MVPQLWPQLKMKSLLGHNIETVMQVGEDKHFFLGGGESTGAENLPDGKLAIFDS